MSVYTVVMKKNSDITAARQTEILSAVIIAVLPDGSTRNARVSSRPRFPLVNIEGFEAFAGIEYSWHALSHIAAAGSFKFNPAAY